MQRIGGREPLRGELGRFYDAIENPRATRDELPILRGDECRAYMEEVRERTLEVLDEVDLDDPTTPCFADGFVYEMLLAHEHQHNETMLQLLQMVEGYEPVERRRRPGRRAGRRRPGDGRASRAASTRSAPAPTGFAYDNERPRHTVELEPFEIDRTPVTNGAFAEFVAETGAEPPMYWERDGEGGWVTHRDGRATADGRPGAAGRPRRLAPGRRLRALGRASGCRPSSSGRRRPRGRRPRARQPRPARLRLRPRRRLRRRGVGLRRGADARRRLGVDGVGLRRPIPASRPSPTPSTRRSSSATSTRCCAAAPGRRAAT